MSCVLWALRWSVDMLDSMDKTVDSIVCLIESIRSAFGGTKMSYQRWPALGMPPLVKCHSSLSFALKGAISCYHITPPTLTCWYKVKYAKYRNKYVCPAQAVSVMIFLKFCQIFLEENQRKFTINKHPPMKFNVGVVVYGELLWDEH